MTRSSLEATCALTHITKTRLKAAFAKLQAAGLVKLVEGAEEGPDADEEVVTRQSKKAKKDGSKWLLLPGVFQKTSLTDQEGNNSAMSCRAELGVEATCFPA